MKKLKIVSFVLGVVCLAISGIVILNNDTDQSYVDNDNGIETVNTEYKVGVNTDFTIITRYTLCNHEIQNKVEITKEMINMTYNDVANMYRGYEVVQFNNDKVVLKKTLNEFCKEHYLVKEIDGKIGVYRVLADDKLELIKKSGVQLSLYWYEIAKTDYLVTGMPADQLFGSIVGQNKNLNGNSDWKDFVKIDVAINQFEEAFKHYNMPIKKLNEFLWFMNFSSKWDVVCNLIPWTCGLDKGNTISFFDTKEFQDWSVSNFDILHIYDQKDAFHYKRKMKEFIFNLFKDSEYYFKDKIGSIAYAVIYEEKNIDLNYKSKPFIALLEENDILVTKFYTKEVSTFEKRRIANAMMNRELIKYRLNN